MAKDVGAQPKITANGILKGDGSGNITAANETEVELVSLPNICNPNLLDNWYFGNPVNQRGQTSYTGVVYGIDRWKMWQAGGAVTVENGGIVIRKSSGEYVQWGEMLEADVWDALVGRQVTMSALTVNGQLAITTQTFTEDGIVTSAAFEGLTFHSTSTLHLLDFVLTGAESPAIRAVKLELGHQQTLAHQENGAWVLNEIPDYGEQLRRCQRYYWKVDHNDWPGVSPFSGTYNGERITLNGLTFPVTMRTKPTISNLILYENGSGSSKTVTDSGWSLFDYAYNNIFPTSENLVSGTIYSVQHVEFSADL